MARNPLQSSEDTGLAYPLAPASWPGQNTGATANAWQDWMGRIANWWHGSQQPAQPIWNAANPTGTETLQTMGMPQPTVYAGAVGQYVDPYSGQLTAQGQARLDNPALGFDTGGVGGVLKGFHGSPHTFDRFSNEAIGTGEGAQAYGHGHYLADAEEVAKSYRDALQGQGSPTYQAAEKEFNDAHYNFDGSQAAHDRIAAAETALENARQTTPGHMYEVAVNADPEHFLDWDKPLSEQHPMVQKALIDNLHPSQLTERGPIGNMARRLVKGDMAGIDGADAYTLANGYRDPAGASQRLMEAGIPGIRYLDAGSRGKGEGSRNTVVFDPTTMDIIRRYGLAGLMAGGGAAAGLQTPSGGDQP